MTEPLINPFWFYLLGFADKLDSILGPVGLIMLFLGCISFLIFSVYAAKTSSTDDEEMLILRVGHMWTRRLLLVGISLLAFWLVVPKQVTVVQIIVAQTVTAEFYEKTKAEGKELICFIIEQIQRGSLEEDEKKEGSK